MFKSEKLQYRRKHFLKDGEKKVFSHLKYSAPTILHSINWKSWKRQLSNLGRLKLQFVKTQAQNFVLRRIDSVKSQLMNEQA
jgi:hypothetical protein